MRDNVEELRLAAVEVIEAEKDRGDGSMGAAAVWAARLKPAEEKFQELATPKLILQLIAREKELVAEVRYTSMMWKQACDEILEKESNG